MSRFVLATSIIILTGCVSVPNDQAIRLADSGLRATSALRNQIQVVSDTTIRQTEVTAFRDTALVCETKPKQCGPQVPSGAIISA